MRSVWVIVAASLLMGCSRVRQDTDREGGWEPQLGKRVTVEGKALNAALGALLDVEGTGQIWIDQLEAWPSEISGGQKGGARVRVRGTVIKRQDLPVFIENPGDPPRGGMPVPPGTDLGKAATRYLLRDTTWEVLPAATNK